MTENIKKLLEKVSQDKKLAEKLSKMEKTELIAEAKKLGFELTEEDFAAQQEEMSADELDAVSGGGECGCAYYGGGKKGGRCDEACGCVNIGYGEDGSKTRCACFMGGYGSEYAW